MPEWWWGMSTRTVLKTIVLTLASVLTGASASAGAFALFGKPEVGLNEAVLLACAVFAGVLPFYLFPLIRRTHLLAAATSELDRLARTDALTNLPNRRDFYENAEATFCERAGVGPISVLMIDIDHFKALNDTHGHAAGDAVLAQVASRIGHEVARTQTFENIVGRIGGEEFAIMLVGGTAKDATMLAQRLCEIVSNHSFQIRGEAYTVTLSIGIDAQTSASSVDIAMHRADTATYQAKELGRNRWVVWKGDRADHAECSGLQAA
jgi:diguanylate cyclase (GGDEF)-like protein